MQKSNTLPNEPQKKGIMNRLHNWWKDFSSIETTDDNWWGKDYLNEQWDSEFNQLSPQGFEKEDQEEVKHDNGKDVVNNN